MYIANSVGGQSFERYIATLPGVQAALGRLARQGASNAEERLASRRYTGDSEIVLERGDVDYYITLSDERGDGGALSIEYGRKEGSYVNSSGTVVHQSAVEGVGALQAASQARL